MLETPVQNLVIVGTRRRFGGFGKMTGWQQIDQMRHRSRCKNIRVITADQGYFLGRYAVAVFGCAIIGDLRAYEKGEILPGLLGRNENSAAQHILFVALQHQFDEAVKNRIAGIDIVHRPEVAGILVIEENLFVEAEQHLTHIGEDVVILFEQLHQRIRHFGDAKDGGAHFREFAPQD